MVNVLKRIVVMMLIMTMLVTGSGISVFADSSDNQAAAGAAGSIESAASQDDNEDSKEAADQAAEAADSADGSSKDAAGTNTAASSTSSAEADTYNKEESTESAAETSGDEASAASSRDAETAIEADSAGADNEAGADGAVNSTSENLTRQTLEAEITDTPDDEAREDRLKADDDAKITVSGLMPEGAYVRAYPVKVEIPGRNVVTAYDIKILTADEEGRETEWQPEDAVTVTIEDTNIREAAEARQGSETADADSAMNVYHMKDLDAEPEEVEGAEMKEGTVSFDADSFSIYIISEALTRTYIFMNGTDVYSKQTLEDGQKLAKPNDPVKSGSIFSHWSIEENGEEFDGFGAVTVNEDNCNDDVILYAVYQGHKYCITYYDQNGDIVETAMVKEGDEVDTSKVAYTPIQNQDGKHLRFRYWTTNKDGEGADAGTFRAACDTDLYPVVQAGHWIYFDVNKNAVNGASTDYAAPVFVAPGETPGTDTAVSIPHCDGFYFAGWFTKRNGGTMVFNASGYVDSDGYTKITKDGELYSEPTLYAHWTKGSAEYQVVYYIQKATDTVGGEKHYEVYKTGEKRRAVVGTKVSYDADKDSVAKVFAASSDASDREKVQAKQNIHGFELSTGNESVTVSADGTTELKVLYDRKTFTLKFYDYAVSDNTIVDDTRITDSSSSDYTRPVRGNKGGYFWNYSGRISSGGAKTITALYGNDISAEFPIEVYFYLCTDSYTSYSNAKWTLYRGNTITAWRDADMQSDDSCGLNSIFRVLYSMPSLYDADGNEYDEETLIHNKRETTKKVTYYYKEVVPGTYSGSYSNSIGSDYLAYQLDGETMYFERIYTMNHSYSKNENGFTAEGLFQTMDGYDNDPDHTYPAGVFSYGDKDIPATTAFFYTLKDYTVTLKDPTGTKDDMTKTFKYNQKITADDLGTFTFDEDSNITPVDDSGVNYWFNDEGLASAVDFTDFRMPDKNITLYAGVKKQYIVQIDPAGGELGTTNNYSTWFKADPGELVSEYANISRDYVAADASEASYRYIVNSYDKTDKTKARTAYYEKTSGEDAAFKYEKGAYILTGWMQVENPGTSYELEREYNFASPVGSDLYLRAKWRRNANFTVVYDAGEVKGPKDSTAYEEYAHAIVLGAQDTPSGQRFLHWQDSAGNTYKAGELLTISEDIAETASANNMVIRLTAVYEGSETEAVQIADYTFMNGDDVWYVETISAGEKLVMPERPAREGSTFTGWYTDSACTKRFDGFGTIGTPVHTTLYAGFTNAHTVTYYTREGGSVITSQEYSAGSKLSTAGVTYDTDAEHYVKAWTDSEGNTYPYDTASTNIEVKGDIDLWPVVKTRQVLRFVTNGGTRISPAVIPADRRPAAPAEPEKQGFIFEDWYTTSTFEEGTLYDFSTALPDGVNTLYAKWAIDENNPAKGTITVLFWAQTPDRPADDAEAARDKTHYELASSAVFTGQIYGTYDMATVAEMLEDKNIDYKDPVCLTDVRSRYSDATDEQFRKYFAFNSAKSDSAVSVDAAEGSVLNLYYDRSVYSLVFNMNGYGSIHYDGAAYTGSGYTIDAWLDRPVSDLWPVISGDRQNSAAQDKAWVEWNSSSSFKSWGVSDNTVHAAATVQVLADMDKINYAASHGGTLTFTAQATEPYQNVKATVHYYIDGAEKEEYKQDVYIYPNYNYVTYSNFRRFYGTTSDGVKYYSQYAPKEIEGYEVISSKADALADGKYNPVVGSTTVAVRDGDGARNSSMNLYFYYKTAGYELKLMETGDKAYGTYSLGYGDLVYSKDADTGLESGYVTGVSEPERPEAGKKFVGWSTTPAAYIPYTANGGRMPAYSITLYAVWEDVFCTVKLSGVSEDGSLTDGEDAVYENIKYGTRLGDLGLPEPVREGYTFSGWQMGGEPMALLTEVTSDMTLEPVWKKNTGKKVVYDANSGMGEPPVDESSYAAGANAVVLSGAGLSKSLKDIDGNEYSASFVHWNTAADDTGIVYYPGSLITVTDDVTLYAIYSEKREADLIYSLNCSDGEFAAAEEGVTLSQENKEEGTIRVLFNDYRDLIARDNDGSSRPNTVTTIGTDNNGAKFYARRPGYVFAGWSLSADAETAEIADGAKAYVNTLGNGNVLYAVWKADTLRIAVYEYEDDDFDSAEMIEGSSGSWQSKTVTENMAPDALETSYRTQQGYSVSEGFKYEMALVGDASADALRYGLKSDGSGYEWQYHAAGDAADSYKAVGSEALKVYYHKKNTGSLLIKNNVTGRYADLTKDFEFTITIEGAAENETFCGILSNTGDNGGTLKILSSGDSFKLRDGKSLSITIPMNKKVTVIQKAEDGYTTTFEASSGATPVDEAVENGKAVKLTTNSGILTVTNEFADGSVVPSGIEGGHGGLAAAIIALILAEWIVLTLRRRLRAAR